MEEHRIRGVEPPEGVPAVNMPVLAPLLDRLIVTYGTMLFTAGMIVVLGVYLAFSGRYGVAVPAFLISFMTPVAVYFGYVLLVGCSPMRKLTRKPFRLVSGLDDAVIAGAWVSVPLDGRWFVVRLPAPLRAQLAAQRRLWVLGPFFLLPGVIVPRNGKFRDAPVKGSVPLTTQPVSPGRMLTLQRRLLASYYLLTAGIALVAAAFSIWVAIDFPDRHSVLVPDAQVLAALCLVATIGLVITAVVMTKPSPEPTWTELAVISGPASVNLVGMVTMQGRTVLPDGREVTVRAGGSDLSLAANIAATGRLWVLGVPMAGKTAKAGVPGHAVFGPVKFGR
ncbi:hypothetical protein GCM10027598_05750 [Amycolatopsis oliviviridis]|uniref:RDD domain-containing protein n=1 Tax=Amycolatopsis oliviviridis TaxID=1471590 RepID=A0ABQ3LMH7_9PSEU|nr:hypothetical protein [Amycolatopsis oliviviridis]GHH19893.1 hypothetical protein GCM10017790_39150 [Amycolatopsis oliviviridis]